MNFKLNKSYDQVEWFGRGPHENYVDRKTSAFIGSYSHNVNQLMFEYASPQENGYRTDVRWMKIENEMGAGGTIVSPI